MRSIYTFGIHLITLVIRLTALFKPKARKWLAGRKDVFQRIREEVEPGYIVWFHVASVGEFEQARPLIERIKKENPHKKVLLTFFSPSGYELRKDYPLADYVFYLPTDTKHNAKKFIELIQPEIVFFIKYEFWFNYIAELHSRHIPLYLVSGIFRSKQHFFKFYGSWFRKHLSMFKHLFVQDHNSAKLLASIGIRSFSISGDTRFDRVHKNTRNPLPFEQIEDFSQNNQVVLCGSTWPVDEKIIGEYLKSAEANLKYIIAPHEIDTSHLENIEKRFVDLHPLRWSEWQEGKRDKYCRLLIIDSMGQLMHLYQYADIAYVGGGFGVGIHNILEAACFGKPIVFGPNYTKFKEAVDLIELKGAFSIRNKEELTETFDALLKDKDYLKHCSTICSQYVNKNLGATDKIYQLSFEE